MESLFSILFLMITTSETVIYDDVTSNNIKRNLFPSIMFLLITTSETVIFNDVISDYITQNHSFLFGHS